MGLMVLCVSSACRESLQEANFDNLMNCRDPSFPGLPETWELYRHADHEWSEDRKAMGTAGLPAFGNSSRRCVGRRVVPTLEVSRWQQKSPQFFEIAGFRDLGALSNAYRWCRRSESNRHLVTQTRF